MAASIGPAGGLFGILYGVEGSRSYDLEGRLYEVGVSLVGYPVWWVVNRLVYPLFWLVNPRRSGLGIPWFPVRHQNGHPWLPDHHQP
jgi:hypothetical protein